METKRLEFTNVEPVKVTELLNKLNREDKLVYIGVEEGTLLTSFCILHPKEIITIEDIDKLLPYNTITDTKELDPYHYIYFLATYKNSNESDYTVIYSTEIFENHSEIFLDEEDYD